MWQGVGGCVIIVVALAACSSGSEDAGLTIDDVVELPPDETHRQRWEGIEEHKQACMAEEGFQYTPHVPPRFTANSAKALVRGALIVGEDRERVERHGYGLATGTIESTEFFGADPNRALRSTLSREEDLEYSEAFGQCTTEAQEAAGIDQHYLERSMQMTVLISELETEIISDPRLAGVTEQWAACMNERGHSFRLLSDPRDEIVSRMNAFMPQELEDPEAEREETARFYARLLDEELELAVDDLDCREESGVADVLPEVMEEAEAEFLDQHGDLLAEVHAIRSGS